MLKNIIKKMIQMRDVELIKYKAKRKKILLIAYFDPNGVKTIIDHVFVFEKYSKNDIDILNLYGPSYPRGLELPFPRLIHKYDVVVIHNTVSYNVNNLYSLSKSVGGFVNFQGLKVLIKQDEHYKTDQIRKFIENEKFRVLFSVLNKENAQKLYDFSCSLKIIQAHTGYVSDEYLNLKPKPFGERLIDFGYRGSIQPYNFGWLSYEKKSIGDYFFRKLDGGRYKIDISSARKDRINGEEWFNFLSNCRFILGAESGASIIDRNGEVEKFVNSYLEVNPKADFIEVWEAGLKKYEDNGYYKAISPRHLEAAACGAVQILFAGDYSGLFLPDRHYISLNHDYSNFKEVLERTEDKSFCKSVIENCQKEIINSDELKYRFFIMKFDEAIDEET